MADKLNTEEASEQQEQEVLVEEFGYSVTPGIELRIGEDKMFVPSSAAGDIVRAMVEMIGGVYVPEEDVPEGKDSVE